MRSERFSIFSRLMRMKVHVNLLWWQPCTNAWHVLRLGKQCMWLTAQGTMSVEGETWVAGQHCQSMPWQASYTVSSTRQPIGHKAQVNNGISRSTTLHP